MKYNLVFLNTKQSMESILCVLHRYMGKGKCIKCSLYRFGRIFPLAHECKTMLRDGWQCIEIMGY